jgi:N-(2-amino-2-carboxyethyl)-L-glutamate synthase
VRSNAQNTTKVEAIVITTLQDNCARLRDGSFMDLIGNTPTRAVRVKLGDCTRQIHLKLEGFNPGGSIKDRTAIALIRDLEAGMRLKRNGMIVESTSGNLGAALAYISRELGYRFTAVVDPKLTEENAEKMRRMGATLDHVTELDETGGYLLTRLRRVQELLSTIPGAVWPNQYENPVNAKAHFEETGPEILRQMNGKIDMAFLGVSTGGTLAGVSRFLRMALPRVSIVAVDAKGSIALGGTPGSRLLTGIGASRKATLLRRDDYSSVLYMNDIDAFACCRALARRTDLSVGGSSGAVVAAAIQWLACAPATTRAVCLCPDTGLNYQSSIFNDEYVRAKLPAVYRRQEYYESVFGAEDIQQSA